MDASPPAPRSSPPPRDLLSSSALFLATAGGAGYSPVAPGTAGSLVGVATFWAIAALSPFVQLGATLGLFVLGVAVSSRTARLVGRKDPGLVVVDEVVGQWATLLFLPFGPWTAGVGFVLFRVMDVLKPWPARDLESLPGGLGIMADDLMAGVYANLLLRVVLLVVPLA
jgi:phosphatidylglycerophosphatase A